MIDRKVSAVRFLERIMPFCLSIVVEAVPRKDYGSRVSNQLIPQTGEGEASGPFNFFKRFFKIAYCDDGETSSSSSGSGGRPRSLDLTPGASGSGSSQRPRVFYLDPSINFGSSSHRPLDQTLTPLEEERLNFLRTQKNVILSQIRDINIKISQTLANAEGLSPESSINTEGVSEVLMKACFVDQVRDLDILIKKNIELESMRISIQRNLEPLENKELQCVLEMEKREKDLIFKKLVREAISGDKEKEKALKHYHFERDKLKFL